MTAELELTPAQERTIGLLQHLVGLSGLRDWTLADDGTAHMSIMPIDIGQAFNVRPFSVAVSPEGVPIVDERGAP